MSERSDYRYSSGDYEDESLRLLNGWTDGDDPSVGSLRHEIERLDARFLEMIDGGDGLNPWDNGAFWEDMDRMCGVLLDAAESASQYQWFDRRGAAHAAAWAFFSGMSDDLEDFASDFHGGFAEALADPDLDRKEAAERMNWYIRAGAGTAIGDINTFLSVNPCEELEPAYQF